MNDEAVKKLKAGRKIKSIRIDIIYSNGMKQSHVPATPEALRNVFRNIADEQGWV